MKCKDSNQSTAKVEGPVDGLFMSVVLRGPDLKVTPSSEVEIQAFDCRLLDTHFRGTITEEGHLIFRNKIKR